MLIRQGEKTAVLILKRVLFEDAYFSIAASEMLDQIHDAEERALAMALSRLVIENITAVDYALMKLTNLSRADADTLLLLRFGASRILFGRDDERAVVNVCVQIAKSMRLVRQAGYINAVLRNLCAQKNSINWPDKEKNRAEYLSVRYSWPNWAVKQLLRRLPDREAEQFLSKKSSGWIAVRINILKCTAEQAIAALEAEGYSCKKSRLVEHGILLRGNADITGTRAYQNGWISLQSEAGMLTAIQIGTDKKTVLDVCAAPGGKTCAIAETNPDAEIFAFDIHPHRVDLIKKQAKRLGLQNITAQTGDASVIMQRFINKADAVLVDAPCSGLGTAMHRPDVKLKKSFEDVLQLQEMQLKILNTACQYVAPQGMLLYATCTFMRQENEEVVQAFLTQHPEFKLQPLNLPDVMRDRGQQGMVQLWPHLDDMDGFFM